MLSALHVLFNLILKITQWRMYCYYLHFPCNTLEMFMTFERPLLWVSWTYIFALQRMLQNIPTWAACLSKLKLKLMSLRGSFLFSLSFSLFFPRLWSLTPVSTPPRFYCFFLLALSLALCHFFPLLWIWGERRREVEGPIYRKSERKYHSPNSLDSWQSLRQKKQF